MRSFKYALFGVAVAINSLVCNAAVPAIQVFQRTFTTVEQDSLRSLQRVDVTPDDIVRRFEECSTNPDIPGSEPQIHQALRQIVGNQVGRNILETAIAKIEPYVRCERSLRAIVERIPDTIEPTDMKNISLVALLYENLFRMAQKNGLAGLL